MKDTNNPAVSRLLSTTDIKQLPTAKANPFKLASIGVSAIITLAGVALVSQQAQALSALDFVNSISASGGVAVSKDIAYGKAALQNLDI